MKKFDTLKIEKTTTLQKDGMEISAYIAGVNSGVYSLPYVISVETWASKWGFKKFFRREMKLDIQQIKFLKKELETVIEFHESIKK